MSHGSSIPVALLLWSVLIYPPCSVSQGLAAGQPACVRGTVRDPHGKLVAGAQVQLQGKGSTEAIATTTDSQGAYKFTGLSSGVYGLKVTSAEGAAEMSSLLLGASDIKTVDLMVRPPGSLAAQTEPQFYDEPQFTVSGVTDASNLGGHGSDVVVRTRESMAKDTANLAHSRSAAVIGSGSEKRWREALEHDPASFQANHQLGVLLLESNKANDAIGYLRRAAEIEPGNAEAHHWLADAEEKLGDSLEAVRQYERAAAITASEPYLFDWGSELLLHHAAEPAIQVFTKGNALYPRSARMLIGLGAALFARGANDQAVQRICSASDLNPSDARPYRFLGKLLRTEGHPLPDEIEKLHRFATVQPQNPEANYYYALAVWKSRKDPSDPVIRQAESLLKRAVELNPNFAPAHLQLGILHGERGNSAEAISEYQRAVQADPNLEEAHFRLGQAYRQAGDFEKSKEELRIYQQLARQSAQEVERERHEIRQFVYTLRDQPLAPQP